MLINCIVPHLCAVAGGDVPKLVQLIRCDMVKGKTVILIESDVEQTGISKGTIMLSVLITETESAFQCFLIMGQGDYTDLIIETRIIKYL